MTGQKQLGPEGEGSRGSAVVRRRLVSAVLGFVLSVVLLVVLLIVTSGSGAGAVVLKPFSLQRLGGGASVVYPGTPAPHEATVVTFFASWCPGCQEDLPVVAKAARTESIEASGRRGSAPVRFIGIDGGESERSAGLAFARKAGVDFPVGYDYWQTVAQSAGIGFMPTTLFVSPSGTIVHEVRGPVTSATMRTWLAKLQSMS